MPHRPSWRRLIAPLLILALTSTLGVPPAHAHPGRSPRVTFFGFFKPHALVLGPQVRYSHLRWHGWGSRHATGHGRITVRGRSTTGVIRLSRARSCPDGRREYLRETLTGTARWLPRQTVVLRACPPNLAAPHSGPRAPAPHRRAPRSRPVVVTWPSPGFSGFGW